MIIPYNLDKFDNKMMEVYGHMPQLWTKLRLSNLFNFSFFLCLPWELTILNYKMSMQGIPEFWPKGNFRVEK